MSDRAVNIVFQMSKYPGVGELVTLLPVFCDNIKNKNAVKLAGKWEYRVINTLTREKYLSSCPTHAQSPFGLPEFDRYIFLKKIGDRGRDTYWMPYTSFIFEEEVGWELLNEPKIFGPPNTDWKPVLEAVGFENSICENQSEHLATEHSDGSVEVSSNVIFAKYMTLVRNRVLTSIRHSDSGYFLTKYEVSISDLVGVGITGPEYQFLLNVLKASGVELLNPHSVKDFEIANRILDLRSEANRLESELGYKIQ